ncbi:MAG: DUF4988 domain-containing protein, partial [Prevotella sp.]|nr:DUF4988 domain-containing protein [Prevotella sp.]
MGEVVKAAKKGIKGLKIWVACLIAIILVVGSAGGSFLVMSNVFATKLNQMVDEQYKGEKGDTGAPGPEGAQGISILSIKKTDTNGNYDIYTISYSNGLSTTFQVKNGEDGEAPTIGENGNWWVNGTDTGVMADVTLAMPYIGTNGNWWVGDTDTKVPAQGQDGQTPYIKNGNWWIGDTDTEVSAGGNGTGITAMIPLDKSSTEYTDYITQNNLDADVTDVYKITYSDNTATYFHVTNGSNNTSTGMNGADANRWLSGDYEPLATLGNPNDFYLYTTTNTVYQKQASDNYINQYNGKLVEQTIDAETFNELQANAADYGLILNGKTITYAEDITTAQITAFTDATGLETSFYYHVWNYKLDSNNHAHLFGYFAAEGALEINGEKVTRFHYTWQEVTTLQGANGTDGKTAYEVWRDYVDEDNNQPNAGKDENAFLNSLIIGTLEDFTILPSGFWGKKTAEDFDYDALDESEQYLYELVDGVYYENTMVSARGEQGATGQKGEQGNQGQAGYSAYELYTQTTTDNPIKSLDDWLISLVGAKGEQGEKGEDGYTPQVGPNGNWWTNGVDTGVSATVRLPYVGENGNWFINGVDQKIKPTGDRGAAGNGIASIEKTSTVDGVLDTYKITFTNPELAPTDDGYLTPFTFTVTNGTNGKSSYEIWLDYYDENLKGYPNKGKTETEFMQAIAGNGIATITKVTSEDSHYHPDVDTYKITYTAQEPSYFTVKNGRDGEDGKSVYDIWCEEQGYTDYADNKYYTEFINAMSVSTIEGLTVLDNGHWGVLSNYETVEDAQAADPAGIYSVGYQNKIYKDTGNAAKGDTGATGKSAYDIYCDYFKQDPKNEGKDPLSQYDWMVSLKGETGAAGKDAELEITENGYWKIGGVVTNMRVQGEKGEAGDTPYIDANGYWCVGDTNLGVSAKGIQGEKGDTGVSIVGVSKLTADGSAVDTYEIAFSNGTTSTFTVTNGTDGVDGTDGAGISMDFGVPTATGVTGKEGDIYINLNNGEMYRYNATEGWGTVVGTMRGSQWFTGTKTITDLNGTTAGVNIDGYSVIKNDIYLNTQTRDIYQFDGEQW